LRRKAIGQEVQIYKEYTRSNEPKGNQSNVPSSNQPNEKKKKIICNNLYFKDKREFSIVFGTSWIS